MWLLIANCQRFSKLVSGSLEIDWELIIIEQTYLIFFSVMSNLVVQTDSVVTIPFGAWHEDKELNFNFPPGWKAYVMSPIDGKAMSDAQIDQAFAEPMSTKQLRFLAKGKKDAIICVDDITRPTPAYLLLPRIVKELLQANINSRQIRILVGTGAHRPMNDEELALKLGKEITNKFQISTHDFLGTDVRFVGWVKGGPVYLNRLFLEADLRICVGGVIPHGETGFGGGAKMVVPGLSGKRTISHFHGALPPRPAGQLEFDGAKLDRRSWSEAVARHVGVDFSICAVINSKRELAGLFVGDIVKAYHEAARKAKEIGRTVLDKKWVTRADVFIVNSYPLDTDPIQMGKSLAISKILSAKSTVVVNAASDGIFYHGMGIGSGISAKRLLYNVPGFLINPINQLTFLRSMFTGVRTINTAMRLCYFTFNALSYERFLKTRRRIEFDQTTRTVKEELADPVVFSKRFPSWGFRRKYYHGVLYRDWQQVCETMNKRYHSGVALIFPCAPLQLPDLSLNLTGLKPA